MMARKVLNYADAKNQDEIISFVERFNNSIHLMFGASALDYSDYLVIPEGILQCLLLSLFGEHAQREPRLDECRPSGEYCAPEHDSDVVPHSPSSFCVTENSEIAIIGECCSVDSSKLEYTGYSENISNLTNNDVQVSPSPTIRLPACEMITNENTVYSTFNANHAKNNISKKDHKESSAHSYPKYKLPPSIECVDSPLINSPHLFLLMKTRV
ncbi:unnamed protein product [Rhizophagus irregularis]|nr:unnamed protein product [Rhizophagus irregularis]